MNKHLSWRGVTRLLAVQLITTLILAVLCLLFLNVNAGVSAAFGGLVCVIPNVYFAKKLFKHQGARAVRQIVTSFYVGEALKIILTMGLFTIILVLLRINPPVFFGSYITVLMTHWFAPWIISNKHDKQKSG